MIKKIINKIGFTENGFKKYFKNTSWLLVDYGYTLFVSFFVGIAAARYLGPEFFGVMVYSLTLYAVALGISGFGFDSITSRDGLNNKEDIGKIFGTYFYIRIFSSIISFIISIIILYMNYSEVKLLAGIFILSPLLLQPLSVISVYFNMRVESKYNSIAKMVGTTFSSILKILFIVLQFPIQYFGFAVLIDTVITMSIIVFFYLYQKNKFKSFCFDKDYFVYLFKNNWPIIIITIIAAVYTKVNIFMISYFMTDKDVGIYGAAFKLTEIWYNIPALIVTSLFPAIVASKSANYNEYIRRIKSLLRLLIFPFILISLATTLIGPFLINILLGKNFDPSSEILIYLIWTLPLHVFYIVTMNYLVVENSILKSMFRPVLALLLLIVLNIVIYNYQKDLLGFVYANIISYFVSFFVLDILFKDSRNLFLMKIDSIVFPINYLLKILFRK